MLPLLLQAEALELADIRDPIQIISWTTVAIVAVAVIATLAAVTLIWRRRNQKLATEAEIAIRVSPIDKARKAFNILRESQPDLSDKDYMSEVSGVMRDYLEDAYNLPAPERTTEEFFDLLREEDAFSSEMQSQLMDFLQQSDLIKFACQELNANQREPLLDGAVDFVETAEKSRISTDSEEEAKAG